MGFFSSIGNFITTNLQSAVHDVGHAGSQVVNSPLYQGVVTAAAASFGIPPTVTQAAFGLTSGITGAMAGNNNVQTSSLPTLGIQQVLPNLPITTVQTVSSPTSTNPLIDSAKKYWYIILIPFVAIASWFIFKPKNRRYAK